MTTLSTLYRYPIKACRGHSLDEVLVERRGLERDRRFLLVDPEGVAVTQRNDSALALVAPNLTDSGLDLSAPNMPTLNLTLSTEGPSRRVTVWSSDNIKAIDQGDEAAQWFSSYLGAPVRLVYMPESSIRRVDGRYAVRPSDHVSFADGYPILVASQESLDDLNARLETPLPMNRFRPNVVVRGCAPFDEDTWKRIRIGEVELALVKLCARCEVTTIDQATTVQGKEPLKTMSTFRRRHGKAMFGVNAIPLTEGQLRVGDQVEILE